MIPPQLAPLPWHAQREVSFIHPLQRKTSPTFAEDMEPPYCRDFPSRLKGQSSGRRGRTCREAVLISPPPLTAHMAVNTGRLPMAATVLHPWEGGDPRAT